MKNRICPSEIELSRYLTGSLCGVEKDAVEEHLAGCRSCRSLLAETHDVISGGVFVRSYRICSVYLFENRWIIGSLAALGASFVFRRFFVQLLAVCLLTGGKWVIDSKTARMLIMIYESWGRHKKDGAKEATFGPDRDRVDP